jgi:hypothetical protein
LAQALSAGIGQGQGQGRALTGGLLVRCALKATTSAPRRVGGDAETGEQAPLQPQPLNAFLFGKNPKKRRSTGCFIESAFLGEYYPNSRGIFPTMCS